MIFIVESAQATPFSHLEDDCISGNPNFLLMGFMRTLFFSELCFSSVVKFIELGLFISVTPLQSARFEDGECVQKVAIGRRRVRE